MEAIYTPDSNQTLNRYTQVSQQKYIRQIPDTLKDTQDTHQNNTKHTPDTHQTYNRQTPDTLFVNILMTSDEVCKVNLYVYWKGYYQG